MSVWVYLYNTKTITCDCGKVHEVDTDEVFSRNMTNNVMSMAREAGIVDCIWMDNKTPAKDILPIIEAGLSDMISNPDKYAKFNASNGWGTYDQFIPWLKDYVYHLREYPDSIASASW